MRYRLIAVGRLRRGFYAEACQHYARRLRALAPVEVIERKEARHADPDAVREAEGRALREAADGRVVVLDEAGTTWTSRGLARHVAQLETRGTSRLSLLLGGAEGLPEWLVREADETWSLSSMTLPHELARLVTLEQLYRVETLRAGHPYHRDGR